MQNNNGTDENGGHGPSQRDMYSNSPSPEGTENGSTSSPARYIPPHQRKGVHFADGGIALSPIIRPESSMSNATFLTQAPAPQYFTPVQPNTQVRANLLLASSRNQMPPMRPNPYREQLMYPTMGVLPPTGAYRYESANTTPTRSSGISFRTGGCRPGFGNDPGVIGSGMPPRMQDFNIVAPTPRRIPSTADSIIIDAGSYDKDAEHLADLIKRGYTDDPRDIDYGNCGPSRRPDKVFQAILDTPPPRYRRGRVAAAASSESNANSPDALVRASNIRGNASAFSAVRDIPLPAWYNKVDDGYEPTMEEVFKDLPFFDACSIAQPSTAGVIRIRNIPFATSKNEVVAFLGMNAQINSQPVGTSFMAIHIMMCRLSGRTLDCFVEVDTPQEASHIVKGFLRRVKAGRHVKLGDRNVAVEQSSQQDLMAELFPRVKNCTWYGPIPKIDTDHEQFYEGVYSRGFNGFLYDEDYAHLIKHVEMPYRGKDIGRHLVRPYECIIYTIHKYPWFAVEHALLWERDYMFKVAFAAVNALIEYLRTTNKKATLEKNKPTSSTLKELVIAIFTCPGFSESQKACVIARLHQTSWGQYTSSKGYNVKFGGVDDYSGVWPFTALCKKPGVDDLLVEHVAQHLRNATNMYGLSIADLEQLEASGTYANPFGQLDIVYDGVKTLADAASAEYRAIEEALRMVLQTDRSRQIATDPAVANPTVSNTFLAGKGFHTGGRS